MNETITKQTPESNVKDVEKVEDQQRLMRRLGGHAVDLSVTLALIASNPQTFLRETEQNEESFKTGKGLNFIGRRMVATGRPAKFTGSTRD